ncbi:MAG: monofunctional biosynthetic peptidoglycan transglycosylase [Bacteroidales bacterium]|nr:monofunctional biosynthetic peptidoglycan transglycosylase [Bacteroidales bacterium]
MTGKIIFRIIRDLLIFFFISTFAAVIWYRFFPVHITPLMVERYFEQLHSDEPVRWKHQWVSFDKISPHMSMAVIASEDNRFPYHHGFDVVEIQRAVEEKMDGGRTRGASTISQQTAKNVFLWPASNWIRKGFEAYFTFMIETFWSKQRIMEVYLNSIEMGRGLYGVQATAKYNFETTAAELTTGQCALIAATLPNPLIFDSAHPSPYMLRRKTRIMHIMKLLPKFPPQEKGISTTTSTKHHHRHHHSE